MFFCAVVRPPPVDLAEPVPESDFHALIRGVIVDPVLQRLRQAAHIRQLVFRVVGVPVALAVAHLLHQFRHSVPEMEGYRFGKLSHGVPLCRLIDADKDTCRAEDMANGIYYLPNASKKTKEEVKANANTEKVVEGPGISDAAAV